MNKLLRTLVVLLFATAIAHPIAAQLAPSTHVYDVLQNGTKVAEIYVPRAQKRSLYVEHWVLFPGYTYPSPINRLGFEIVQSESRARNTAEFFQRSFPAGAKYIQVTGHQSELRPCDAP